MLELFEQYKKSGKISEALIVGQNIFNKNPGCEDTFNAYFSYLCTLAQSLPSLNDRKQFAEQASIALAFYKENAELNEIIVEHITNYQNILEKVCIEIENAQDEKLRTVLEETRTQNAEKLKQLFALKDNLANTTTKNDLDLILKQIGETDLLINKEALTDEQNIIYDSLTKEHTELISSKLRELEYKENVAYNKKAADAFAKAFKLFHADEGKYRNQTQLFTLASTTLFAYDAARLFNETLIYYNHVYSYIFSKLDDDGKLALTRYSIECERKTR